MMPPRLLGHPVKASITGGFGADYGYPHRGIDYGTPIGAPCHYNGIEPRPVEEPFNDGSFGIAVGVDIGAGFHAIYAHLSTRFVLPGELVYPGQLIGLTGATGYVAGAHLHYQIADSPTFPVDIRRSVDPAELMLTTLGGPEMVTVLDRISRLEDLLGGSGIDAIPRPGLEHLFPAGTVAVPEGQTGPAVRIRGEDALRYAAARGFSFPLGLSQAQARIAELAGLLGSNPNGSSSELVRDALLELAAQIQRTYGQKGT